VDVACLSEMTETHATVAAAAAAAAQCLAGNKTDVIDA